MSTVHYTTAPWWLAVALSGLSFLGMVYREYVHNDKDLATRMAVIETHQSDNSQRLDRMGSKIDQLVQWAMGK